MAAVSHLKNKKEAKLREEIEKTVHKCSQSVSHGVSVKEYLELLETNGIEIEEKEVAKLEKMASDDGLVERHDFVHYAKKSSMFKTLVDAEKHHFDKAELAFKAIDKDGSGYITLGELRKLGNMDVVKTEALMEKLDRDGDGKITLSEFRELFKPK